MREVSEIYGQMLEVFEEKTGFAMDDGADLAVRLYAAAAQLQALYIYAEWVMRQNFPQTADAEHLDNHAALRGITRKNGAKAEGVLRFRIEQALGEDLPIEKGVVCTTAGLVRFETTQAGAIKAGELYADVPAVAQNAGAAGNVPAQSITQMSLAPAGVVGVTNPAAFTGGTDAESDEALRARVMDTFLRLPNGANAAFYASRALSHEGVEAVEVIPRVAGVGTVGLVVAAADGVDEQALFSELRADIEPLREIAVDVQILAPQERTVDVDICIKPAAGVEFEAASAAVQTAIGAFFNGKLLGKPVYCASLCAAIYNTGMVENYRLLAPWQDMEAEKAVLPKLGTLRIVEAEA